MRCYTTSMEPKIVTFDIENMANLLWSWQVYGKNWSAIDTEQEWHMLCFAAKWLGKKTEIYSLDQYKGYKPMVERKGDTLVINRPDERALLQDLWNMLDEADIVIGWNSKRFDTKKVQSKLLAYGFPPPSPFKQIDVMCEKKKIASSNSNKLDVTGEEWGLGRKLPHQGFPLWKGCSEGDEKAWNKMKRYNIQDVILTEKTYLYLRPWMATHPNLNAWTGKINTCPVCQKEGTMIKRGFAYGGKKKYQQYHCTLVKGGCNKYTKGEIVPF